MNKARDLIERGNLKEAKNIILELEQKASHEKSPYSQQLLLSQIHELKSLYVSKENVINFEFVTLEQREVINTKINFESNNKKIHKKDLEAVVLEEIECNEAKFENCIGIEVVKIKCKQSLLLINIRNSRINCFAHQIRLINCENVTLTAFSATGIFLQESAKITIRKNLDYEGVIPNNYNHVSDFSDPFGESNYILEIE